MERVSFDYRRHEILANMQVVHKKFERLIRAIAPTGNLFLVPYNHGATQAGNYVPGILCLAALRRRTRGFRLQPSLRDRIAGL